MGMRSNIVLIGMMGSGKSTVGKLLARELDKEFVDTDKKVEEMAGRKIEEIFMVEGEEKFRCYESCVIKKFGANHNQVIATGGGVVLKRGNMEVLRQNGILVFLNVSLDQLIQRLQGDSSRPLIKNNFQETLKTLFNRRIPLYLSTADIEINTDGLKPEEVAKCILKLLP